MTNESDLRLRYQDEHGQERFMAEAKAWCLDNKLSYDDSVLEDMYDQLQELEHPVDFHYPTAYGKATSHE